MQKIILLVGLFLTYSLLFSQTYPSKNYNPDNETHDQKVFSIAQDRNGFLFFAQDFGIYIFNGFTWTLLHLDEGATTLAADTIQNQVFVGNTSAFGVVRRNLNGDWEYQELTKLDNEVGDIVCNQKTVYYYTTNSSILRIRTGREEIKQQLPGVITGLASLEDKLLVNLTGIGLCLYHEQKTVPITNASLLAGSEILFSYPLSKWRCLIGTKDKKLFIFDSKSLQYWIPEKYPDLAKQEWVDGGMLKNGRIWIATTSGGVFLYNQKGEF
ncbi:MAG: hypothetical protein NZ108_10070, partial [Bacteroidia bacterium]|nr:hypothetical protein [Bacteroidia bacterium]